MNDIIETQNQELIQNVSGQIESINRFIAWGDTHLQESRREETFKKLVNIRRHLKRLLFSLESNPAITAFGESQKGKSHVVGSLLACKGRQFTVVDPKDGTQYDFVGRLNPITKDTEATGVATRFTRSYTVPDNGYPILVKILPVADIRTGMKDAVEAAYRLAKKGETVLLSPCCASFDLFTSYEDRGDQFKKYVREL